MVASRSIPFKRTAPNSPLRQLPISDLGHENPTLRLTNRMTRTARNLIGRYAKRVLIENNIEDGTDFFHIDAFSSTVAVKVDCDLELTQMASSLYRVLACQIGNGHEFANSCHLFREFIDTSAAMAISEEEIDARFQKRVRDPSLIAAGYDKTDSAIPWLGKDRLRLVFGESAPRRSGERGLKSEPAIYIRLYRELRADFFSQFPLQRKPG